MFFESKLVYKLAVPDPLSAAAKKAAEVKALKSAEVKVNALKPADKKLFGKYIMFFVKQKVKQRTKKRIATSVSDGQEEEETLQASFPKEHQQMTKLAKQFTQQEKDLMIKKKIEKDESKRAALRKSKIVTSL